MADLEKVLKRIPDDVVEYKIYPLIPDDCQTENEIQNFLDKHLVTILAHISDKAANYIWQHEPFVLSSSPGKEGTVPPHYHGSTGFGDNIDDEWFIVYLLYEITREFSGTVVKVCDNDEEFLLIEAADTLPSWLDPESAENRVYVYNGDLHIIPIPQTPEEFLKYPMFSPAVDESLVCVRNTACDTRGSQAVQDCINRKMSGFPKKLRTNLHHINCYLPTPLAAVLSEQPTLVSAGVRRFYYRDPLELKACRPMKRFKPDDLVQTRVKMTRCQYAQLSQQRFTPDRRSGWPLVVPSNREFKERDIGIKLAHGFEILCADCPDHVTNGCFNENVDSNPKWQQFKKTLHNKGYFRGEIEGSKLYKQLLQEARQFFKTHVLSEQNGSTADDTGMYVLEQIRKLEPTLEDLRREQPKLPPSDDDSWMTLSPEDVDGMMKQAGGEGLTAADASQMFDLGKVAQSMNSFVEHESSMDGAEFPKNGSKTDEEEEGDGSTGLIHQMQKMFDFPEDKDSSGSDMSEYDWSEDSEEDLGSPTKMPEAMRKGSKATSSKVLRSNLRKESPTSASAKESKSVRFSSPGMELDSKESESINNGNNSAQKKSSSSSSSSLSSSETTFPSSSNSTASKPSPSRPENLPSAVRPARPPPPCPTGSRPSPPPPPPSKPPSNAPPLPPHPPRKLPVKPPRPLAKPNGAIKPSAPPPPPPPPSTAPPTAPPRREKRDRKLETLMDAMDRELSSTEVGKSFERVPKKSQSKANAAKPQASKSTTAKVPTRDIDDEDDDFRPVDVDYNVVKNTLESFKAQQGLPGPASNILSGFGIKLPQDNTGNGTT